MREDRAVIGCFSFFVSFGCGVRGSWVGCGWCTAVLLRFCAIMPQVEQLMRCVGFMVLLV